jgi:hypothetical protein
MPKPTSKSAKLLVDVATRGYRVTTEGLVVAPSGRVVKTHPDTRGYLNFTAKPTGGDRSSGRRVYIHRLVAYQKYGSKLFTPGLEVRHLDNNKLNNDVSNIAIGTHQENQRDHPEEYLVAQAKHAASFRRALTTEQAQQLVDDRAAGATYKELMAKYGVAKSTVSYIVNGRMYPELRRPDV